MSASPPFSFSSVLNALVEHRPSDICNPEALGALQQVLQPWEGLRHLIEGGGAEERMASATAGLRALQFAVTEDMLRTAVRLIVGVETRKREGQAQVPPAHARSTPHPP